jgi:hypothetical protein
MSANRPSQRDLQRKAAVTIVLITLSMLGIMSLVLLLIARHRLAEYALLDREGVRTTGKVTGFYRTYLLAFQFEAAGRAYRHSSVVSSTRYYAAHKGEPAEVIYLPRNPDICRLAESAGPQKAATMLRLGRLLLLATIVVPACLWLTISRSSNAQLDQRE